MTRSTVIVTATALLFATAIIPAISIIPAVAQGVKQTVTLTEVNPLVLATGYRSSKFVGSTVYNDAKEDIGKVDDLIISAKGSVPYAVLSVGEFLGMGKHQVVVPASSLDVVNGKITLRGGSKESLKALPDYTYTY